MKITLNNREYDLDGPVTLAEFVEGRGLPREGIAVAVNDTIVPRDNWQTRRLADGDRLIIIKAVCGG